MYNIAERGREWQDTDLETVADDVLWGVGIVGCEDTCEFFFQLLSIT